MLVQRIEYQCNYSSKSSTIEDSKSSECNTLIEAMKNHSIVEEPVVVYSSPEVELFEPTETRGR